MMEEKLLGCGIKACLHIKSRIKTLKKLWQTAYDMVYGPNTSGFGWDPDTKCVTADKDVWDEYIKSHLRAAQFHTKSFPYFESLSMVWGRDRAVGDEEVIQVVPFGCSVRTVTTENCRSAQPLFLLHFCNLGTLYSSFSPASSRHLPTFLHNRTTKPLSVVFNPKQNQDPVKHPFLQPPPMARVKMTEERMKEMGITIDDVKEYRRQRRHLRRCTRDVGSKYKTKVSNWYDDFEATTKWKRGIETKEARKIQREAKNKGDATVSQKRKEPPQVDPNSAAPPKNKKQKAEQVKQGKKKVVVSESSSSDDKEWKPTPSAN
ncbi:hypothetical protein K1719_000209 [Acacia pycnantha]|nr:hypothetical protein K1719_000209 [Acacia pycnantha]